MGNKNKIEFEPTPKKNQKRSFKKRPFFVNSTKTKTISPNKAIYKEAFAVAFILLALGLVLNLLSNGARIKIPNAPYNVYILLTIITVLVFLHIFFQENKYVKKLSSVPTAVGSIIAIFIIILLMGFIPQSEQSYRKEKIIFSLNDIKHSWLLAFNSFFMLVSLGLVTLKRLYPINRKNIGFVLNHGGLWLIVAAAALGSADVYRLRMKVYKNEVPLSRAYDNANTYELPIAVKLLDFDIETYRPKIAFIDNQKKQVAKDFQYKIFQAAVGTFQLDDINIQIKKFYHSSIKVENNYVEFFGAGASPAAYIKTSKNEKVLGEQWVSCGSYIQAAEFMPLDEKYSLALLRPEPQKYFAKLKLYSKDGSSEVQTIEVNKPYTFKGWTIYQLDYDENKGKWSNFIVLELVKDPWLPLVYSGLFMMLAGSLFLFWSVKKSDEEQKK